MALTDLITCALGPEDRPETTITTHETTTTTHIRDHISSTNAPATHAPVALEWAIAFVADAMASALTPSDRVGKALRESCE